MQSWARLFAIATSLKRAKNFKQEKILGKSNFTGKINGISKIALKKIDIFCVKISKNSHLVTHITIAE